MKRVVREKREKREEGKVMEKERADAEDAIKRTDDGGDRKPVDILCGLLHILNNVSHMKPSQS